MSGLVLSAFPIYLLAADNGWVRSSLTGMELRASDSGKLIIRLAGDDATRAELPED
jgi:hypothetical protein